MNVNASAPYVSVHEPLLYSRKNRLIKRQLVDLRYSLCLRGEWLSLSLSLGLFPSLSACVSLHGRPLLLWHDSLVSLRLFLSSPPFSFFLLPFCFYELVHQCAPLPTFTYHNTQWKNVVSLSNYKIRCECTLHAVHFLRLIAIFFLAVISCVISIQTILPRIHFRSETRHHVLYSNYPDSFTFVLLSSLLFL